MIKWSFGTHAVAQAATQAARSFVHWAKRESVIGWFWVSYLDIPVGVETSRVVIACFIALALEMLVQRPWRCTRLALVGLLAAPAHCSPTPAPSREAWDGPLDFSSWSSYGWSVPSDQGGWTSWRMIYVFVVFLLVCCPLCICLCVYCCRSSEEEEGGKTAGTKSKVASKGKDKKKNRGSVSKRFTQILSGNGRKQNVDPVDESQIERDFYPGECLELRSCRFTLAHYFLVPTPPHPPDSFRDTQKSRWVHSPMVLLGWACGFVPELGS